MDRWSWMEGVGMRFGIGSLGKNLFTPKRSLSSYNWPQGIVQ
jgi:hypothetical protein